MKIENTNIVLALVFGFATLSSVTTFAGGTFATNYTTSSDTDAIDLGNPFFVEHYQTVVEKPYTTTNMSLTESFTGKGVLNGTLAISIEGNASGNSEDDESEDLTYDNSDDEGGSDDEYW